jgi:phosphoribosyl 1,2-cyclic phosphodiesterase
VLASGSKGNSIYLATERVQLLFDAGLSAREIERRLSSIKASPKDLDGIVVTHEHIDHVRSVGSFARRYKLPVYLNKGTYSQLPDAVGRLPHKEEFVAGRSFRIGDVVLHPFSISHDAADPVGFTLENDSLKIGLCTDLGATTRLVCRHLGQCAVLILEANYDLDMLKHGPYPWPVKQRIKSRLGHLSNQQSSELLAEVFNEGLQEVILAHMSETNNCAEVVLHTFIDRLDRHIRERLKITLASQHHPLDIIEL